MLGMCMQTISYQNPATGQNLGTVSVSSPEAVKAAFAAAKLASKKWGETSLSSRLVHLEKGKLWLIENVESVVDAISLNNGKPRVESLMSDVAPVLHAVNYYSENAASILADKPVSIRKWLPTKKAFITYSPLGVVGIISPWNYPFSIPMGEVLAALVAGNCIILKPSEVTSLVNKQIQKFINACELPSGIFQMLEGDGSTGAALTSLPLDKFIFTGSVSTGKRVMKAAAENLVPLSLELGGKDPCIVFEDADIDIASSGVVVGGFFNNGQTCCSVERLLVHKKIEAPFIAAVKSKISRLRMGPSHGFENDLGPMTYEHQKAIIKTQLDAHGTPELYDGQSNFIQPVLIKTVNQETIWNEETFGPVVAYDTFETDDEAIAKANHSKFGLGAVIWSRNASRARAVARRLYTGTVVINDAPYTNAITSLPWGGVKDSGMGRVHGKQGLRNMCLTRVISHDIRGQAKQLWWFPYSLNQYQFLKAYALFTSETRFLQKMSWLLKLIRGIFKLEKRL